MRTFFVQRWFLLSLVLVLVVGITWAHRLEPLANKSWLRDLVVATVMFLMALPLEARAMFQTLRQPGPPLLAFTVSFVFLPLFAWLVSMTLNDDLGAGLQIAAATPCTLASASVWTRRAGGNDAVSTLVTLLTNMLCFVITPLWVFIMTGNVANNPELSLARLTGQLGLVVVLPMLFAQMLRVRRPIAAWATRHKVAFGVASQVGILTMILFGAIRTGLRLNEQSNAMTATDLVAMIVAVLTVHLAMFWLGVQLAKLCGFSRENQIAVGFSGSQKTLMVGLVLAITLKISILPMVAFHCLQLFVDTLIADAYRKQNDQALNRNDQAPMTNDQGAEIPKPE
jgi:sodium/bile acid cotransporter 7